MEVTLSSWGRGPSRRAMSGRVRGSKGQRVIVVRVEGKRQ